MKISKEKVKKFGTFLGYILMCGFYLFILANIIYRLMGIDWGFLHSEITAYGIRCVRDSQNKCVEFIPLQKRTFKINKDGQYVLDYASEDQLLLMRNCAVKDRKNWQCKDTSVNLFKAERGFRDGEYFDTSVDNDVRFVSKWTWYKLKHPIF